MCSIVSVSRASYYKYLKSDCKSSNIDNIVIDIFNKTGKKAGYRTIKMLLNSRYALSVNHKKVQRIMRENGLKSIVRPKICKFTEQRQIKDNILSRDFIAAKPNQKYVTDITYIPIRNGMMYLSTVIDLYDNYPVVWLLSDCIDKQISINTMKQLSMKFDLNNVIIHSDQGIHYSNKEYVELLKSLGVKQSMSRKGNCWDNAPAESFFSQYKCECIYLQKSKLTSQFNVREITEEYLDYYINDRPQKRLNGLSPGMFRERIMNG